MTIGTFRDIISFIVAGIVVILAIRLVVISTKEIKRLDKLMKKNEKPE